MDRPAERKIHFAPLARQQQAIEQVLSEGRYRNVTHFMRQAIDYYLERVGRPTLTEQARQMAEDFNSGPFDTEERESAKWLQDESRDSDESW